MAYQGDFGPPAPKFGPPDPWAVAGHYAPPTAPKLPAPAPRPAVGPATGPPAPTPQIPHMTFPVTGSPAWYAAAPPPSYGGPTQPTAPPASNFPTFDWKTDPGYLEALSQEQSGLPKLDQALAAARSQAVIGYGDPSIASLAGFSLDPETAAMAAQSSQSGNAITGRLQKAHDLARQAIINKLAGQGILGSGDLGYLSGQENQSYGNQLFDARQQELQYLAGLSSNYMTQRQALHNAVIQAMQNAYQTYVNSTQAAAYYGTYQ